MKEDDKNDGKTNTSNNTNTNRVSRDKTKKSKDAKKQMDVSDNVAGVPKDLVGVIDANGDINHVDNSGVKIKKQLHDNNRRNKPDKGLEGTSDNIKPCKQRRKTKKAEKLLQQVYKKINSYFKSVPQLSIAEMFEEKKDEFLIVMREYSLLDPNIIRLAICNFRLQFKDKKSCFALLHYGMQLPFDVAKRMSDQIFDIDPEILKILKINQEETKPEKSLKKNTKTTTKKVDKDAKKVQK